ncbi:LacI family DNA-binding transcriptional regulator [uncultured Ruthenibacterium sp.]|uniref:LacI family DNA-binding transcriptional regulator n=1 Tax=uncultured Ruthenibacterium sp. TaxID=1905347 RepID=UPI00349EA269
MEKVKSIKEIARLAGVSTATVSRVINQNGRFSKETEERVRRIIRQTDYVPNMSAKGLRTNRTRVVGLVVPDITNPHFSSLVLKLEMNFFERGYSCLICNTNESEKLERKHIHTLSAQNVSGIVLISGTRNYTELGDLPVIYVDRPSRSQNNNGVMIESDNEEGGYLATKELLDAGCRHPLILKCLSSDTNQISRYSGFQRALAERNIVEDANLYVDLPEVSSEKARDAVTWLLKQNFHFDGIMCTTDTIAAGALIALREHGLSVPEDVLVTGFDDSQLAVCCGPGITSVHQDVSKMAQLATELLLEMICGRTPQQTYYQLPVHLSIRASTKR